MATLYKFTDPNDAFAICTETEVSPKNGTDFSLEELKSFVDGWIEIVDLRDGRLMVVNEEGKLLGLPLNLLATVEYQKTFGPIDQIVGNALVCKKGEIL